MSRLTCLGVGLGVGVGLGLGLGVGVGVGLGVGSGLGLGLGLGVGLGVGVGLTTQYASVAAAGPRLSTPAIALAAVAREQPKPPCLSSPVGFGPEVELGSGLGFVFG